MMPSFSAEELSNRVIFEPETIGSLVLGYQIGLKEMILDPCNVDGIKIDALEENPECWMLVLFLSDRADSSYSIYCTVYG